MILEYFKLYANYKLASEHEIYNLTKRHAKIIERELHVTVMN